MFTGIVEELGEVVRLEGDSTSARLTLRGPLVTSDVRDGGSIAVNGCCLTVVEAADGMFTADVMAETLARTSLGDLGQGSLVNLERAVTAADRLAGHLVQGHVDGTGTVVDRLHAERWDVVTIAAPAELMRYVAHKGSIAVDGVSLTVSALDTDESTFQVSLIPTTLRLTTLGIKAVGDRVNLEVDVIAKYVERLLGAVPIAPTTLQDG
jgi:riboflavin synthase